MGIVALSVLVLLVSSSMLTGLVVTPSDSTIPIKHLFIIVQENHTFDNYFGYYPGANGLANAVPQPEPNSTKFVAPFEINSSVTPAATTLCHYTSCAVADYNGGKMDGFLTKAGENTNETMGYFNPNLIPYYWDYASQYVLMDNFFSPVLGPSLPNHIYLLAGQSGGLTGNNNSFVFTFPTIVNELDAANVSWTYYSGSHSVTNGWNPLPSDTPYMKAHPDLQGLKETTSFPTDITQANFPSVAWIMPETDALSEHPPYNVTAGEQMVVSEVNDIMQSQYWSSSAIIITWDDYGGWYDHVVPPSVDQYGVGFRLPALILSPYAKHGFVDSKFSEFASTLKLIETMFNLPSLGTRDTNASNLLEAFDFGQHPQMSLVLPGQFMANQYPLEFPNGTLFTPPPSIPAITSTNTYVTNYNLVNIGLLIVGAVAVVMLVSWIQRRPPSQSASLL